MVMVRLDDSQVLDGPTLAPLLGVNVTCQDTEVLVLIGVVLFVVSVLSAALVAFVSVFENSGPAADPPLAPQLPSVKRWMDRVPLSGAPWPAVTVALSLGTQVCCEAADVVSVTVKHSPELASLDPV